MGRVTEPGGQRAAIFSDALKHFAECLGWLHVCHFNASQRCAACVCRRVHKHVVLNVPSQASASHYSRGSGREGVEVRGGGKERAKGGREGRKDCIGLRSVDGQVRDKDGAKGKTGEEILK